MDQKRVNFLRRVSQQLPHPSRIFVVILNYSGAQIATHHQGFLDPPFLAGQGVEQVAHVMGWAGDDFLNPDDPACLDMRGKVGFGEIVADMNRVREHCHRLCSGQHQFQFAIIVRADARWEFEIIIHAITRVF